MTGSKKRVRKTVFIPEGRGGTEVCNTTFMLAVGFVFTVVVCMIAALLGYYGLNNYTYATGTTVIINAPESFINYEDNNEYEYGYIFYDTWNAPYDFMKMSEILHEHSAGTIIVFPEDFDESLTDGQVPSILTYYRTDSLYYKYIRDDFVDEYLDGYKDYLSDLYDIPDITDNFEVIRDDVPTDRGLPWGIRIAQALGRNFIPILIFIALLYAAMSSGTEAISGQKERGTFSRILLTPVSRRDIVLSFTKGVLSRSLIPAFLIIALTFLIPVYRSLESIFPVVILTLSLAFFISSLTIMVSIMNESVTSAQTAFLPIFFILMTVAVTCINGDAEKEPYYYYIPVYGQFCGLGNAFNGDPYILPAVVCSVTTILLGILITMISTKLLSNERFTVLTGSSEEDDGAGEKSIISPFLDFIAGMVHIVLYPLVILSVFQLLAMIPVAVAYMRDPAYSEFIANLADVSGVADIIDRTMEILGIFMNDGRFLALMSVSYILMIIVFIIHEKSAEALGLKANGLRRIYLIGMGLGAAMMTIVYILLMITGKAAPEGIGLNSQNAIAFMMSLLMWVPQGASEEVMFRGFMLPRLKKLFPNHQTWPPVLISSFLFAVFHGFNKGVTALAIINIFLFAILFALIYEKTKNLFITCAAHTMWNLLQGSIFGLSVSGNDSASLIATNYTGSSFGPEGTWEASVVIVGALILFAVLTRRKKASSPKK